jgi:hypothetical protein
LAIESSRGRQGFPGVSAETGDIAGVGALGVGRAGAGGRVSKTPNSRISSHFRVFSGHKQDNIPSFDFAQRAHFQVSHRHIL